MVSNIHVPPPSLPSPPTKIEVGIIQIDGVSYRAEVIFKNSKGEKLDIPDHFLNDSDLLEKTHQIQSRLQNLANEQKLAPNTKKLTRKGYVSYNRTGTRFDKYENLGKEHFKSIEKDLIQIYKRPIQDEVTIKLDIPARPVLSSSSWGSSSSSSRSSSSSTTTSSSSSSSSRSVTYTNLNKKNSSKRMSFDDAYDLALEMVKKSHNFEASDPVRVKNQINKEMGNPAFTTPNDIATTMNTMFANSLLS